MRLSIGFGFAFSPFNDPGTDSPNAPTCTHRLLQNLMPDEHADTMHTYHHNDYISRLPADVMILIFEQGIVHDHEIQAGSRSRTTPYGQPPLPFPFRVSHVSQKWREVAVDFQPLWSKFSLHLECMSNFNSSLLHIYLERSGSCLLDMDLTIDFQGYTSPLPRRNLWTLVVEAIVRWHRVSIRFDNQFYIHPIAASLQHQRAPCLEQLCIVSNDMHILDDIEEQTGRETLPATILQGGATKLKDATLIGIDLKRYYPPLSGLRDLRLRASGREFGMSHTQLCEMLKSSPGLERLCLDTRALDVTPVIDAAIHAVEMPSLLELQYTGHLIDSVRNNLLPLYYTLVSLHAPSLDHLVLHIGEFWDPYMMLSYLRDVTVPRFPRVAYLEVEGVYMQNLIRGGELMFSTPAVTTLVLGHHTATPILPMLDHRNPKGASSWPELREVIIYDTSETSSRAITLVIDLVVGGRKIERLWLMPDLHQQLLLSEGADLLQGRVEIKMIENAHIYGEMSVSWRG